ncbi:MAG: hypothetical protein KBA46_08100 [Candidatus Omnitrophica bacterium]|nr:hypothetical protein [Candidatus Omnitrophota bacterium]
MSKYVLMVVGFLLLVTVGCAQEQQNLLLDDFEGAISGGATGTVDFGAGNGSAVTVTGAQDIKNTGSQSLKVEYDAVTGGYMYIARGFGLDAQNAAWLLKPEEISWNDFSAISFSMYGTDSKAQVAFDVKDSGGEIWRYIVVDDAQGWQQEIHPFDEFFARTDWQPDAADKNGVLDFPIKSFQFEPLAAFKGTLYFDTVELIKQ